jgi:ABC-type glutathione transport system ATPase component
LPPAIVTIYFLVLGGVISLIGLPGSGKSTVGRQLARRLQVPFSDSDHVIEQRLGWADHVLCYDFSE